jgi:archaetidylinositol phosphate synthase
MLTKLKQKIQKALTAEANAAHKIGLTPNKVTVIGFIFSFLAAISYALTTTAQPWFLLLAVALILASGFCDALDGIIARVYGQTTVFGGFLDSMLDRYSDALAYIGIIIGGASILPGDNGYFTLIITLTALASSFMVSYSRARAEAAGIKMESVGIAERAERIIILMVASIAGFFWLPALAIGVLVIAVLATVTVLQRGLHVYRTLQNSAKP